MDVKIDFVKGIDMLVLQMKYMNLTCICIVGGYFVNVVKIKEVGQN